jgi:hypothetical protein
LTARITLDWFKGNLKMSLTIGGKGIADSLGVKGSIKQILLQ